MKHKRRGVRKEVNPAHAGFLQIWHQLYVDVPLVKIFIIGISVYPVMVQM